MDNSIENDNKGIFKFDLITKIDILENYNIIKKVLELPHNTIGILNANKYGILNIIEYDKYLFLIYSSKTFTRVKQFDYYFKDAVKTENDNLVLCDDHYIYLYKLIKNEYISLQKIKCYTKTKQIHYLNIYKPNDCISFIFPLKNNNLIVCSYTEMKIYKIENEKYSYSKTIDMKYYIQEIIEIKPNIIAVHLIENIGIGFFIRANKHYIGVYNLQNDKNKILGQNKTSRDSYDRNLKKNLIIIDKYLIARYGDNLDIYDIEVINENDYEIKKTMFDEVKKILKYEMPF